jgi:tetratricopeptide (TPR) repeat protein
VPADDAFDAVARRGIDHVYNLEFESAEKEFHQLVALQPANPAGHFFLSMITWWRIMIDMENEQYDARLIRELDQVVELCDSLLDKNEADVNAIFFKGGAIGFKGRLQFHRNDYLAAANAGRRALPLVQRASELDPANTDVLLGSGIYNYYAEVIPNEYPWVKPLLLFIPAGDKAKGIEQLTTAAEKGRYAVESAYFLLQIMYFYERDYPRALELAERLHSRFPDNMLFHRYVGRSLVSLGRWDAVRQLFSEVLGAVQAGKRGYGKVVEREARYYLGVAEMTEGKWDPALAHFYRCDELSRELDRTTPSGFMSMANLKVGNIYDAQGKRDLAQAQYRKVLGLQDYKDSHAQAEQFLAAPYRR